MSCGIAVPGPATTQFVRAVKVTMGMNAAIFFHLGHLRIVDVVCRLWDQHNIRIFFVPEMMAFYYLVSSYPNVWGLFHPRVLPFLRLHRGRSMNEM